ncbi:MAG: hypothetical protein ABR915_05370 [Thermoguttaceae bacterium]
MRIVWKIAASAALGMAATAPLASGCHTCGGCNECGCSGRSGPPTAPLGALTDPIWQRQEAGAAASDFVVYQHEFEMNDFHLNTDGEDHVKAIASRLHAGACLPVVIERGMTTARPDTQFKYPIHPNPELDLQRRDVVVRALTAMGIADAEQRVSVAPAMASGQTATEAARSYRQGLLGNNYGYSSGLQTGATTGLRSVGASPDSTQAAAADHP